MPSKKKLRKQVKAYRNAYHESQDRHVETWNRLRDLRGATSGLVLQILDQPGDIDPKMVERAETIRDRFQLFAHESTSLLFRDTLRQMSVAVRKPLAEAFDRATRNARENQGA
ncbi:hypothetical protein [Nocardia wallacei]|uniref:hypothetical protein n=1 Tax=Nocardia wallacei TaxID=480035 RepID=UPI00245899A4|nr:hypothetical protein [Nocardia wallacei]